MNLVYGALLLHSAGKPVTEDSIKKVAEATGEHVDGALVKALVAALEGVNIDDIKSKAAMPVAVAATPVMQQAEKKEEVSEEEKEKKAEEAAEGLGALFG